MKCDLVFLYGILKNNNYNELEYLGEAAVSGTLYDLGSFPGFKHNEDGVVRGQLFKVLDDTIFNTLDMIEGVDHDNPNNGLYKRIIYGTLPNNHNEKTSQQVCYMYEYNGLAGEEMRIDNGIW